MCRIETLCNLDAQGDNSLLRQCTRPNDLLQVLAFEKLHHDEVLAVVFTHVVDCADIRMVQR